MPRNSTIRRPHGTAMPVLGEKYVIYDWSLQAKHTFCERLAAVMRMKPQPSPWLEPPLIYRNVWTVDISTTKKERQRERDQLTPPISESTDLESIKGELRQIRHLMITRVRREEVQRYEADRQRCKDDRETEMRNDWMLAAAVLDRICAILITAIFVVGTVTLFVMFSVRS